MLVQRLTAVRRATAIAWNVNAGSTARGKTNQFMHCIRLNDQSTITHHLEGALCFVMVIKSLITKQEGQRQLNSIHNTG
jgi:hypothetical protein